MKRGWFRLIFSDFCLGAEMYIKTVDFIGREKLKNGRLGIYKAIYLRVGLCGVSLDMGQPLWLEDTFSLD